MDEILASIRRIIADEDGSFDPKAQPAEVVDTSGDKGEGLAAALHTPRPVRADAWQDRTILPPPFTPRTVHAALEPRREMPETAAPLRAGERDALPRRKDLLAPETDAAVGAAFDSLGALAFPERTRTVEDLMKEMLRPMLKTWLDDNLPRLVEGLVRQEIERITRSGR